MIPSPQDRTGDLEFAQANRGIRFHKCVIFEVYMGKLPVSQNLMGDFAKYYTGRTFKIYMGKFSRACSNTYLQQIRFCIQFVMSDIRSGERCFKQASL